MKMVRVTVTKGVTANIGNYESIRIDATAEFEVDKKDQKKCFEQGYAHLDNEVNKQLDEIQSILHPKSAFNTK